mgnify:CR=1 FL=1
MHVQDGDSSEDLIIASSGPLSPIVNDSEVDHEFSADTPSLRDDPELSMTTTAAKVIPAARYHFDNALQVKDDKSPEAVVDSDGAVNEKLGDQALASLPSAASKVVVKDLSMCEWFQVSFNWPNLAAT